MDILQQFTRYIQQIGYSKGSQYQIPNCIKEFLGQCAQPETSKINQSDILHFYDYLQTRPLRRRTGVLSEAMINHYVCSLKTFFGWLEQTQQIQYNPISNIKFKRPQGNPREPLSQKEIQQLFEAASTSKETAILHLFYSCGLRRTEAENLNTADIHFSTNILYIREGKGAKRRAIPINEKVKKALESYMMNGKLIMDNGQCTAYMSNERGNRMSGNSYVMNGKLIIDNGQFTAYMINERGNRMSGDSYNRALKEILKRTAIKKEITLHHLRHSIATHLLENGMSIEFVRDFLGHSHLEATQIYAKVFKIKLKNE